MFHDRPGIWRVFREPELRSTPMIVPAIGHEHTPEMRLVHDYDVIETLSSDRCDRALDVRVLPRTRRRGHDFGDAHAHESALEHGAVDAVPISV